MLASAAYLSEHRLKVLLQSSALEPVQSSARRAQLLQLVRSGAVSQLQHLRISEREAAALGLPPALRYAPLQEQQQQQQQRQDQAEEEQAEEQEEELGSDVPVAAAVATAAAAAAAASSSTSASREGVHGFGGKRQRLSGSAKARKKLRLSRSSGQAEEAWPGSSERVVHLPVLKQLQVPLAQFVLRE
jgi:hypothetical protein